MLCSQSRAASLEPSSFRANLMRSLFRAKNGLRAVHDVDIAQFEDQHLIIF
jgi:hypothetical protein